MKALFYSTFFLMIATGCVKQPSLPVNSPFTVTSMLNDSTWYGTGEILRIKGPGQQLKDVQQFNLIVHTDIDYPGMGSEPNPKTNTGCVNRECTQTQTLVLYNIPLRKGRTTISKLNKRSSLNHEQVQLSYVGNAGGLRKRYINRGLKPSWVRVTNIDKTTGMVEGRFTISLNEDMTVYSRLDNGMSETARFTNGLFRIKITDIVLK